MAKAPPGRRDDITDPHEILIAEVAAAREQLRELVERMKTERLDWERRLLELQRSPRLTMDQKKKLQLPRGTPK